MTTFNLVNQRYSKITEDDFAMLEAPISDAEHKKAVMHFKPDKTPGVDGMVSAFYQEHWDIIRTYYVKAIEGAFSAGKLHISARRGVLSLIPKKDKDILHIKNWRPLTMLTID